MLSKTYYLIFHVTMGKIDFKYQVKKNETKVLKNGPKSYPVVLLKFANAKVKGHNMCVSLHSRIISRLAIFLSCLILFDLTLNNSEDNPDRWDVGIPHNLTSKCDPCF